MGTYSGTVTIGIVLTNPALQNPTTVTSSGYVTNTNPTTGDAIYGYNTAAWTLVNYGTINATADFSDGVDFKAGGLVVNQVGGLIVGPDGIEISGAAGTVLNAGTIAAASEYGVRLEAGGVINNSAGTLGSAEIIGGNAGILLFGLGGTVNNGQSGFAAATISGATYGVWSLSAAATVTNYGTIEGNSGAGVFLYAGGVVTNGAGGVLASSNNGIQIRNAVGSVDNSGTVQSGNVAVTLFGGAVTNREGGILAGAGGVGIGGLGTLANLGTITGNGTTGSGVIFSLGGSVENGASAVTDALIAGTLRGVTIYTDPGSVTNFGTIAASISISYAAAVYLHGGGSVVNQLSGLIESGGDGVSVGASITNSGAVTNLGTVVGANASGIGFTAGGSIANSGLILGGNYGVSNAGAPISIDNSGTIAGSIGVRLSASTLTNSGTIVGDGVAVYFTGAANRLIVEPGAVFSGTVFGGATNDTLQLAAGASTGTISGLGAGFNAFEQIAVDESAVWLLSGSNALAAGTTLSNAGTLTLGGSLVNDGAIGIGAGAELVFAGAVSGAGTIDFAGLGGTLEIDGATMPSNTITGVDPGDIFELPDVPFDVSGSANLGPGNVLHITQNGNTLDLQLDPAQDFTGLYFHLASGGGGTVVTHDNVACYCRGTSILTARGYVPIEELTIGDRVVTVTGDARPIKWIGRRAYDPRFVAGNRAVLPIRVRAGALADGVPARDLRVSPGHAFYIDGVLVPVECLVNGATIVQEDCVERLEYFHIEFDKHEVIFAEAARAESFVDCDNRLMFHNGAEFALLYPDDNRPRWQFWAPRLEWGSAGLTAIRAALLQRVVALGHRIELDPDLHLIADGTIVRPDRIGDCVYRFDLPALSRIVVLASRNTAPAEIVADSRDMRRLGVPIERLALYDSEFLIEADHNHPALREGFHDVESNHRWTDGSARLPESWLRPFPGRFTLELRLASSELFYRAAPRANIGATPRPAERAMRQSSGAPTLTRAAAALHASARRR